MKTLLAVVVMLLPILSSSAETLVGKVVPPYPDSLTGGRGSCISLENQPTCARAIGIISRSSTPVRLVVEELIERTADGMPRWRVLDEIPYPKIGKGTHFEHAVCRVGQDGDDSIVAVVADRNLEWLHATNWAYRVDGSGHFVKLDPDIVKCGNTAIGSD